jgi:hypothetical protein
LIKIIVKKLSEHQLVKIEDSNLCVKSLQKKERKNRKNKPIIKE